MTEPFGQLVAEANNVRIPTAIRADAFGRNRGRLGGLSGQPRPRPLGSPLEESQPSPSRRFVWRPFGCQTPGRRNGDIRRHRPTRLASYHCGSGNSCLPASHQLSHMRHRTCTQHVPEGRSASAAQSMAFECVDNRDGARMIVHRRNGGHEPWSGTNPTGDTC